MGTFDDYDIYAIDSLVKSCHKANANWWIDINTGTDLRCSDNVPEKLCLIHSEISEALEGHRKGLMDNHLPMFLSIEVELADALCRIFDLAGAKGYKLGEAFAAKMRYNATRIDHQVSERKKDGGKKL